MPGRAVTQILPRARTAPWDFGTTLIIRNFHLSQFSTCHDLDIRQNLVMVHLHTTCTE